MQKSGHHAQFSETGHQVLLGPVSLGPIAVATEQLQVFDVVRPAGVDGNEMVHLQVSEFEGGSASSAMALLLAKENVLVLTVRPWCVDVGAGGDQTVVKQAAHGLLEPYIDQLHGFG